MPQLPVDMRIVFACFMVFSLSAKQASAQLQAAPMESEISVEGAADFRSAFEAVVTDAMDSPPPAGAEQAAFAPAIGASYYIRIPNLRAYFGPRLEAHYADWDLAEQSGLTYTASALFGYKAFLFDMEGDCDCPRWDKSNLFKKAFFVEFAAGYGRQSFSESGQDNTRARNGAAYLARLGLSIRLKKRLDVYVAGGGHGIIAKEWAIGRHDIAIRPALGITWRP